MRLDRWLGGRTVIKELFRRLSCKVLSSPPRGPAHYIGFRWMHFWAGYQKSPTPPVWNSVRGRHLFNWIDQIPSVLQDWPGHHHWLRAHVVCYKSKWMDAAAVTFSCGGPLRQWGKWEHQDLYSSISHSRSTRSFVRLVSWSVSHRWASFTCSQHWIWQAAAAARLATNGWWERSRTDCLENMIQVCTSRCAWSIYWTCILGL